MLGSTAQCKDRLTHEPWRSYTHSRQSWCHSLPPPPPSLPVTLAASADFSCRAHRLGTLKPDPNSSRARPGSPGSLQRGSFLVQQPLALHPLSPSSCPWGSQDQGSPFGLCISSDTPKSFYPLRTSESPPPPNSRSPPRWAADGGRSCRLCLKHIWVQILFPQVLGLSTSHSVPGYSLLNSCSHKEGSCQVWLHMRPKRVG